MFKMIRMRINVTGVVHPVGRYLTPLVHMVAVHVGLVIVLR